MEIDIPKLTGLLENAKSKHGWKKERRFLNLRTVENFIYHLPKIKDRSRKEFAYNTLLEYLSFLNQLDESDEVNARLGDDLFSKYLNPLTNYYNYRLGFSVFIHNYYLLALFIITQIIAYLFDAALIIHTLILMVWILYLLYQIKKVNQKKVYGIFY